jgi:hypothetical protein
VQNINNLYYKETKTLQTKMFMLMEYKIKNISRFLSQPWYIIICNTNKSKSRNLIKKSKQKKNQQN